jgi:superfamily I DNA/RNA helicase
VTLPVEGSAVIHAGPGSGKTTLCIDRVRFLIERLPLYSQVACITYTNTAADKTRDLLGQDAEHCFVGTIHSFLTKNVLIPYGHLLGAEIPDRFRVVTEGFARPILQDLAKRGKVHTALPHMDKVLRACEGIGYSDKGDLVCYRPSGRVAHKTMQVFKEALHEKGLLDQQDALWYSYRVLLSFSHISRAIRCHYPFLVVDEYQDTNNLQDLFIRKMHQEGATLFLVGDRDQSIFSFAGAAPNLFSAWENDIESYSLDENYRSSRFIVDFMGHFRSVEGALRAVGDNAGVAYPVHILVGNLEAGTRRFLELCRERDIAPSAQFVLAWSHETVETLNAICVGGNLPSYDISQLRTLNPRIGEAVEQLLRASLHEESGEMRDAYRCAEQALSRLLFDCNAGLQI